jgi:hypothetical protein
MGSPPSASGRQDHPHLCANFPLTTKQGKVGKLSSTISTESRPAASITDIWGSLDSAEWTGKDAVAVVEPPSDAGELKLVTMLASALLGTSRDRRQNRPGKAKPDTFARVHLNLNLFPSFPSFFPLPILSSF